MMVTIMISFDLLPGVEEEYGRFVTERGVPYWKRQEGLLEISGYRNLLGGSPHIVSQMKCRDGETALRILSDPEYREIVKEQARFVTDRSVLLLEPSGRTPQQDQGGED